MNFFSFLAFTAAIGISSSNLLASTCTGLRQNYNQTFGAANLPEGWDRHSISGTRLKIGEDYIFVPFPQELRNPANRDLLPEMLRLAWIAAQESPAALELLKQRVSTDLILWIGRSEKLYHATDILSFGAYPNYTLTYALPDGRRIYISPTIKRTYIDQWLEVFRPREF